MILAKYENWNLICNNVLSRGQFYIFSSFLSLRTDLFSRFGLIKLLKLCENILNRMKIAWSKIQFILGNLFWRWSMCFNFTILFYSFQQGVIYFFYRIKSYNFKRASNLTCCKFTCVQISRWMNQGSLPIPLSFDPISSIKWTVRVSIFTISLKLVIFPESTIHSAVQVHKTAFTVYISIFTLSFKNELLCN